MLPFMQSPLLHVIDNFPGPHGLSPFPSPDIRHPTGFLDVLQNLLGLRFELLNIPLRVLNRLGRKTIRICIFLPHLLNECGIRGRRFLKVAHARLGFVEGGLRGLHKYLPDFGQLFRSL